MLLSAVSVLVVAQSSSEIPEGLMNNPVLCKITSSPSNSRRSDAADQSRSRRAADICVLETDLPGEQYGMEEEFTEKLIE